MFDKWQQTNGKNTQITGVLQFQKQLKIFHKIFLEKKLTSDVQNVHHRSKRMVKNHVDMVFEK